MDVTTIQVPAVTAVSGRPCPDLTFTWTDLACDGDAAWVARVTGPEPIEQIALWIHDTPYMGAGREWSWEAEGHSTWSLPKISDPRLSVPTYHSRPLGYRCHPLTGPHQHVPFGYADPQEIARSGYAESIDACVAVMSVVVAVSVAAWWTDFQD